MNAAFVEAAAFRKAIVTVLVILLTALAYAEVIHSLMNAAYAVVMGQKQIWIVVVIA